jgi:hypothetical protein
MEFKFYQYGIDCQYILWMAQGEINQQKNK